MANIKEIEAKYLNKNIKIISMDGEPGYNGKEGLVEYVDGIGQLFGTWGGLAVNLDVDTVKIIC